MNIFIFAALVSVGINIAMFVPAFIYKTDKITDISYAVTFAVIALAGYMRSTQDTIHKIVLFLVFGVGSTARYIFVYTDQQDRQRCAV